jgi:hypothetical protein
MMTIVCSLAGIWLGVNFSVFVLFPLLAIAGFNFAFGILGTGLSFHEIFVAVGIPLIAVQFGYMIGLISRDRISQFRNRIEAAQSRRV